MTKLRGITSPSGARFTVADEHADKFGGLVKDLEAAGIKINPNASGGYNPRNIRGSNKPSNHAFGRAIDVNWDENQMGTAGKINPEVARSLAAKYGMTWGGDWKNRPDPMHFEIAGVPNVPLSQRAFTRVAGVQQTEPPTKGAPTPMPSYKNVGGQTYMGPEAAQQSRRLAEMLINQGTNQEPMTHWTQALGKVLMTGSGALRNDMAMNDVREGQAAGNQALASMLMGGDASAAMTNPYSQGDALNFQVQQKMLADRTAAAERLKRMELEARNADPKRQLEIENLRSQIRTREAGGVAGIKAEQKAATEADTKSQGKKALSDQLGSVVSSYLKLDQLGGVTNPDRGALENLGTSLGTSAAGQMFGKMTGSETQSIRERIVNARPLLIQGIRQATGMSARAMDSNRELDFYLQAASDPTKDIYSNLAAIDVLDRTYGLGNLLETMVQDGSLPKATYDRVKQQASLAIQQRPIATEQPGAIMPAIEVPQGGASNLKSKYGLE